MSDRDRPNDTDGAASAAPSAPVAPADDGVTPREGEPAADRPGGEAPEASTPPATDAAAPEGPDADEASAPVDERSPQELRAALAAAEAQRDEYLDDLRRARAEFENFRRRTAREAAATRELGRADVAAALLDVLDDLDRTVDAADGSSDETLAKGVDLVADKLRRALEGQGVQRVDATGVPFDPEVHEAVQQVEADEPSEDPSVHTILRPGYRLGDRTLRAAMVVVAS